MATLRPCFQDRLRIDSTRALPITSRELIAIPIPEDHRSPLLTAEPALWPQDTILNTDKGEEF